MHILMDFYLNVYFLSFKYMYKKLLLFASTTAYLSQGKSEANRIFYLAVPQEALLDVTSSLSHNAQTQKGWNRIIIEKPFGFDAPSSHQLTQSLLSKFEENQIYRFHSKFTSCNIHKCAHTFTCNIF